MEESIHDQFVEEFIKYTKSTSTVGHPFDEATFQGPQVSQAQYEKVLDFIEVGKQEGAKVEMGGGAFKAGKEGGGGGGYFIEPTVFSNVSLSPHPSLPPFFSLFPLPTRIQISPTMRIVREEIFGPVICISKFRSTAEAIQLANDSSYGLAAAVFTENLRKGHVVAAKIQAGMVWLNSSGDSHWGIPFGGYKQSGIGRELGSYALEAYTQTKAVHVNLGVDL